MQARKTRQERQDMKDFSKYYTGRVEAGFIWFCCACSQPCPAWGWDSVVSGMGMGSWLVLAARQSRTFFHSCNLVSC